MIIIKFNEKMLSKKKMYEKIVIEEEFLVINCKFE